MMTPAAPIVVPPDYSVSASTAVPGAPPERKRARKLITRKNAVFLVCAVELFGSIGVMAVYIYALAFDPSWYPFLVPIPSDLCNATNVVRGVMYIIVLLCAAELVLAFHLLDGARREKLGKIRFWLSSMLTYLALVTIVILGMDLGGIRCPTMNSAAFINIFLRFIEILAVYAWAEQESMRRKLRLARLGIRLPSQASLQPQQQSSSNLLRGLSTLTICTLASAAPTSPTGAPTPGENGETITTVPEITTSGPPPSYASTVVPSSSMQQQQHLLVVPHQELY